MRIVNQITNVTLKLIPVLVIIGIAVGCGGVKTVTTGIHIPELNTTQYNDTAYTEGWKLLKEGSPAEALKRFQESNVTDEKLYVGFGYAFLAENKLSFARKNFEKALALNPDNLEARFGMATMYELLKDVDRAFEIYSQLRTQYPENAWVKVRFDFIKSTRTQFYLEQARQYQEENNNLQYIESLKKVLSYSPDLIDVETEMAEYYSARGEYGSAERHYENIVQHFPNKEAILLKLAEVYEKDRKIDSAVVIYRKLLELKPGDLAYINKVNDLKVKFYEINMPEKFKNIFFKQEISREELAALIGHYFEKYLEIRQPVIITDISGSFAMKQIISVCTLGIMKVRPDHSFDRFSVIDRAAFAVVISRLLDYLKDRGYRVEFAPPDEFIEPGDVSQLHKDYGIIKLMVNSDLVKLDDEGRFNPTAKVTPAEVLLSIRRIINTIE